MHEFKNYSKIKAIINGKKYSLWVADDYQKMKKGLSGIDHLPSQSGMIFIYSNPVNNTFTMKKTKIPLEIIFLDSKFKVVDHHSCKPFQKDPVKSKKSYMFVIEIPGE